MSARALRAITSSAAISPKIAPEAPEAGVYSGVNRYTAADPTRPESR